MRANKPKTTWAIMASVLQWEREHSNNWKDLCSNYNAGSHEWRMESLSGFIPHHYLPCIFQLEQAQSPLNAHSLGTETWKMLRIIRPYRIQPEVETATDPMAFQAETRAEPLKQILEKASKYCIFIAESLPSKVWHCGTCVNLAFAARLDTTNMKSFV